jgi:hypothetical protein
MKVYLLSKVTVSVELTPRTTAFDVCVQIKKRLGLQNDADYALFGEDCLPVTASLAGFTPPLNVCTRGFAIHRLVRGRSGAHS